ncbi:translocation/assembly module TamB domain-containing protein [Pseudoalteromonas luteoviolacea]|uniref:translocation/assembly module TamB domain-containing protein n=1 Tax=Pseudoalteromonas luteoviolacea TaxID=43657 RepID=UPI0011517C57|nr:translocation/assembly module TamB domain-containing protein [Pseudoalteromonas luteoviolacea]TQF71993.1 hypothetical protein FLM44_13320 [Pseudoalteromonas luteoviolacea]
MDRDVKKRLVIGVSALFLTVVFLISTPFGNKLLVSFVNYFVAQVRIELREGKLLSGGQFSIDFQTASTHLHADKVSLNLNWFDCATLCIALEVDELKVTASDVATEGGQAQVADETESELSEELISFPLSIGVSSLKVDSLIVDAGGHKAILDKLQLVASARESLVSVEKLHSQHVYIEQYQAKQTQTNGLPESLEPLQLPSFHLPIEVDLANFQIAKLAYQPFEQAPQHVKNLALIMSVKSQVLRVDTVSFRYELMSAFASADYDLNSNSVRGGVSLAHPSGAITANLHGDLQQLNILAKVSGDVSADGHLSVSPAMRNWPFDLDIQLNKASIEDTVALSEFKLKGKGNADNYSFSMAGNVDLNALYEQAANAHIQASIVGSLSSLEVDKSRIEIGQAYTELVAQLDWQQGLKLDLVGKLKELPIPKLSEGPNLRFSKTDLGVLSGNYALNFKQQDSSWSAQVDELKLYGSVAELPVSLALKGELNDQLSGQLNQAEFSYGSSKINVTGEVGNELDLKASFNIAHMANEILPLDIAMHGQTTAKGLAKTPKINLHAQIAEAVYQEFALKGAELSTEVDLSSDFAGQLSLTVAHANAPGIEDGKFSLSAQGDRRVHQANIALVSKKASAELALTGQYADAKWMGQINSSKLSLESLLLKLNNSIALEVSEEGVAISQHCWQVAAGQACLAANQQGQSGDASVSLSNVPLQSASAWVPDGISAEGSVTGESKIQWADNQLNTLIGRLELTGGKVVLSQPEQGSNPERSELQQTTLTVDSFDILLRGDENSAHVDWQIQLAKLGNFNGKIHLPDVQNSDNIKGFVDINAIQLNEFTPYLRALAWPDIDLAGKIGGRIEFASDTGQPMVYGRMRAEQISVLSSYLPMQVSDLNLDIDLRDDLIELNGQLKTPEDGVAAINGKVLLQPNLGLDVKFNGQRLFFTPMAGAQIAVSPDLHIKFSGEHLNVVGDVTVPFARFTLNELPEGAILVSEDQVILDDVDEAQKPGLFDYQADIDIRLLDDVRIVALGLDAYLYGELSLEKQLDTAILAAGEVSLREGKYTAFGQDLFIQTGQLGFNGPLDKPYLNVRAIRNPDTTANGVIAGVSVQGSIAEPELTIFSEPAMDQAKALAYLLNGEALGAGESSNNTMLAQFLLSKSIDKSKGLFTKAGKKLGLKDVNLAAKGSGDDTQVELSGYITPSVQVSYRVGVFASLSEIAVRYRIFSKLYIEATSGLYDSIDLLYKFDWGG